MAFYKGTNDSFYSAATCHLFLYSKIIQTLLQRFRIILQDCTIKYPSNDFMFDQRKNNLKHFTHVVEVISTMVS